MEEMRIEKKESFQIIGFPIHTTNRKKQASKAILEHWKQFHEANFIDQLIPLMDQKDDGILGVNVYNVDKNDAKKLDYYIAVASSKTANDLVTYQVPECLWAIFPCTTDTIGKTEVMAISKWLPKSQYKPLNSGYITGKMKSQAPDIEYYGQDHYAEVWIAVRKK